MTIQQFFDALAQISGLLFIVTSMLAMGMSLTMTQILQPLKNIKLVILALLANFVLVPALAYLITMILPMEQSLRIGLMIMATAAGAPFLPKLVQGAKGNIGFGVAMMVLLMVATIIYMPIVLPLLLPGVQINPWDIAKSLIVIMLLPLAIGLLVKSHSSDTAAHWQPLFAKTSSLTLIVLLVVALGLNVSNIIDLIGSLGILALLLMIIGSLLMGLLLGGRDPGTRNVMGLGAAQRNIGAAILVAAQNFSGTATLPFVLVGGVLGLLILLPTAKRFSARGAMATVEHSAPAQVKAA